MIIPRLVLGTARIAGGASAREAVDLVKSAFDSGICAVDTAPSYGIGTAEDVVGSALVGYPGVEVATKVGSHRPDHAMLRSFARKIKRLITGASEPAGSLPSERIAQPTGNDFSASFMAQSLEISLEKLGRIDLLMLHDITPEEVTAQVLADLARLGGQWVTGYASLACWNSALDQCFTAGRVAQCAPDPQWLLGTGEIPAERPLRLHSLVKTGLALAEQNTSFANGLERAAGMIEGDPLTARIAALYALAAVRIPTARLLFTSSHRARLNGLIKALQKIDDSHSAPRLAALFTAQAG